MLSATFSTAGTIPVDEFSPPARLVVDRRQMTPAVITRTTQRVTLRFDVVACDDPLGQSLVAT